MLTITNENFDEIVLSTDKPVVIDFWASWCGPCMAMAPVFEEAAEEMTGKAVFAKLNVDECSGISAQYNVMSIPTIIVFQNGRELTRSVGLVSKSDLLELVD